jgi:hypothetical protein
MYFPIALPCIGIDFSPNRAQKNPIRLPRRIAGRGKSGFILLPLLTTAAVGIYWVFTLIFSAG